MEKRRSVTCVFRQIAGRKILLAMNMTLLLMLAVALQLPASNLPGNNSVAQDGRRVIKGQVTDSKKQPMPGVTLLVKGTSLGVATDIDGNYEITIPSEGKVVLQFSFIGMKTKDVTVGTSNTINVTLEDDAQALEEVVVTGYQTVHKRNTTASIATVKGDAIADIPVASISEMLSGKVAGLQSLSLGGGPGSKSSLVIRGNTVMSGNLGEANEFSDPLYVIDGVPMSLQDLAGYDMTNTDYLASLNPDDVESIDILKDASAAAIYGSRGANGVIIIKTKGGRVGDIQVTVKASYGINVKPELFRTPVGSAERNAKIGLINQWWGYNDLRDNLPMVLTDSLNPSFNNNIDYQGLFYQTGRIQSYDVSLTGGTEALNYRLGLGYYNEKGIVKATGFDRYTMTLNVSQKFREYLRNQTIINLAYTDRKTGMGDGNVHNTFPVSPQEMNSSLFNLTEEQQNFLVGKLDELYNKNRTLDVKLSNFANLDLYKGITLNSQIGLSYHNAKTNYFQPSTVRDDKMGYANYYNSHTMSATIETYLSYTKDIRKDHNINLLLGNSFDYNQVEDMQVTALGGSGDMIKVITGYKKEDIDGSTDISMNSMLSFWGRAGYRFKDRYMVDFNYRRDASSRFGKNNRWGGFPAASIGWIFSDESFLDATDKWLTFGKIKFSYGKNGKQFTDNYLRYNMYKLGYNGLGARAGNMNRNTYNGVSAIIPDFSKLADNNLSWEESTQWDLGVELEFFNKRLFATFDVYNRKTDALLFDVPFPAYTGYSNVKSNVAGIMNYGYEITLDGFVFERSSDYQIEIQTSLSRNTNMVTKLPNNDRDYINKDAHYGYMVGKPGPIFYGLRYDGPLDNMDDRPVNPFTGKPVSLNKDGYWGSVAPGYPIFADINGDYIVSDNADQDEHFIERDPNPKIMGNVNLTFTYKQWKLKTNTQFIFGRDIYDDVSRKIFERFDGGGWENKSMVDLKNYSFWTHEGCGARFPALVPKSPNIYSRYAYRQTSMFFEKGDYWKINDIQLTYNFDGDWMTKLGVDRLYVYGTVYNVWQWQKSKNVIDATMVDSRGYTYGDGYPQARKFVFGLNVQF